MPELVEEKSYGCRGVTDEEGRPNFFDWIWDGCNFVLEINLKNGC